MRAKGNIRWSNDNNDRNKENSGWNNENNGNKGTDSPVAFWYVQGHRNGRSWVRTPAGTSGASKTATGMAHFSIMWQGPPTMADEAFPGG